MTHLLDIFLVSGSLGKRQQPARQSIPGRFLSKVPDDLSRISDSDAIGWDIAGDHTSGTDGDIVTDPDTGQNRHTAADPAVVADCHLPCPFLSCIAALGIRTVASGVDTHVWTNEAVIPDRDIGLIQNRPVEIGEEPFP